MAGHALVVGGTGMLSGAVRGLKARDWTVSVVARRASAFAMREPGVIGLDCNYNDADAFAATLNRARDGQGPIALAVGWFHKLEPSPVLANRMGSPAAPGRFFHVLGSAMADPERPGLLDPCLPRRRGRAVLRLPPDRAGLRAGRRGRALADPRRDQWRGVEGD